MTLLENLIELGFTHNQSVVYLAAIESGTTKAGAIIEKTGLHRNIVYTVLDELVRKKLVYETKQRGITYYAVANPKALTEEFKSRYELAGEVVQRLTSIPVGKPEIFTLIGEEGIVEYLKLLLGSNFDIYTIGANYGLFNKYETIVKDYLQKREKNNHKSFILAYHDSKKDAARFSATVRFLSPSFSRSPLVVDIFGEHVVQFVWQEPVVISIIKHKVIADGYRKYFDILWKVSST